MLGRRTYAAIIGGELALWVGLLAWDVAGFDWLRGYDAYANWLYAETVVDDHRLPSTAESGVWHSPPLWFLLAGLLGRAGATVGIAPQLAGQLLALAAGLALLVLVLLLARAIWAERHVLHVVSLGFAAVSPVLIRASVMYHPETLAAALAAAGVLIAVRTLRSGPTLLAGACSGLALGLGVLTRTWVLPVAVAVVVILAVGRGRSRAWAPAALCLVALITVTAPWFVNQQLAHGSALAFNRPAPAGSIVTRRPASFWLGPRALEMFDTPHAPHARNQLAPQLFADWWGDYWLVWGDETGDAMEPSRVRQSWIGLLPTILGLGGIVALALLAVARRDAALALLPATVLALGGAFVLFQLRYPFPDGDTIKATYLLIALPALALGAAFAADVLCRRSRAVGIALGAAAAVLVASEIEFLLL